MDEERRWDGSNAQWLLKRNVYDTLCNASDRIDELHTDCILDYIFGMENSPNNCINYCVNDPNEYKANCHKCIEDFLYKRHK